MATFSDPLPAEISFLKALYLCSAMLENQSNQLVESMLYQMDILQKKAMFNNAKVDHINCAVEAAEKCIACKQKKLILLEKDLSANLLRIDISVDFETVDLFKFANEQLSKVILKEELADLGIVIISSCFGIGSLRFEIDLLRGSMVPGGEKRTKKNWLVAFSSYVHHIEDLKEEYASPFLAGLLQKKERRRRCLSIWGDAPPSEHFNRPLDSPKKLIGFRFIATNVYQAPSCDNRNGSGGQLLNVARDGIKRGCQRPNPRKVDPFPPMDPKRVEELRRRDREVEPMIMSMSGN